MRKSLLLVLVAAGAAFGQYKLEPAGPPPSELGAGFADLLQKVGQKVVAANGSAVCELWFRASAPSGPKSAEEGVTFPSIPHGAYLGAIRFPPRASDRRGQNLKPGVYTLRYSLQPVNGDHLGVAPQRDFLVMTPAAEDKDPAATPKFDDLMVMSRKASGTPHPAVLGMSAGPAAKAPELKKEGDSDWVLNVKIGEVPVSVIVVGKVEG
jgi:hypothetical protein